MAEYLSSSSGAALAGSAIHRGPGRPRSVGIEKQVLRATADLITGCENLDAVTMTAIVEASGVSRAAIYRRWPSREKVLAAALNFERTIPCVPDTGDLLVDILDSFRTLEDLSGEQTRTTMAMARKRIVLGLQDPALMRENWVNHVSRRRDGQRLRFQIAVERGELPPDADVEAIADLVAGVFYYQVVVRGEAIEGETAKRVKRALAHVLRP